MGSVIRNSKKENTLSARAVGASILMLALLLSLASGQLAEEERPDYRLTLATGGTIEIPRVKGRAIFGYASATTPTVLTVLRNGEPYIEYTLENLVDVSRSERLFSHFDTLSPDQRYIPRMGLWPASAQDRHVRGQRGSFFVILVDLVEGQVFRQEVADSSYPVLSYPSIRWIGPTKFLISGVKAPSIEYLLHNVDDPSLNGVLLMETEPVWSLDGRHYATVFGKRGLLPWPSGAEPMLDKPAAELFPYLAGRTEVVKYMGHWVYPERFQSYPKDTVYPPIHRQGQGPLDEHGFKLADWPDGRRHVFSTPVFLGDTTWFGFLEHVYADSRYDNVLETNLVLIDAHRVNSDPPRPEDVRVVKKAVPSLVPKNAEEYVDLAKHLTARWNAERGLLEVVQTKPGLAKERERQLWLASLTLPQAADGAGVPQIGACAFQLREVGYAPLED